MGFATLRLGKDSVEQIRIIDSLPAGVQAPPHEFRTKCAQLPNKFEPGDFVFIWFGSDNDSGTRTDWKQGFRAIGQVSYIDRAPKRNDKSTLSISIGYVMADSVSRVDFLKFSPWAYYWCSSVPIIGLDDRSNQTVRQIDSSDPLSRIEALLHGFASCDQGLRRELPVVYEEFQDLLSYAPRSPLEDLSAETPQTRSVATSHPRQLILYGAPGTGKSHELKQRVSAHFSAPDLQGRQRAIRITFHPEYSFFDFVGSYRPSMNRETSLIEYSFVPGPFALSLCNALNHPESEYLILIEELNRANPAAVFGDLFQLLDREATGESSYPTVVSEDFRLFLEENLTAKGKEHLARLVGGETGSHTGGSAGQIVLPANLFIWATVNPADQGVYVLDTAFKRRWSFEYMDINTGSELCVWDSERRHINDLLLSVGNVPEDKLIGPFFLNFTQDLSDEGGALSPRFTKEFEKVLMYLYDDAAKYHLDRVFNPAVFASPGTLSQLLEAWKTSDFGVFVGLASHADRSIADRLTGLVT